MQCFGTDRLDQVFFLLYNRPTGAIFACSEIACMHNVAKKYNTGLNYLNKSKLDIEGQKFTRVKFSDILNISHG